MTQTLEHQLKDTFRRRFPEYARELDSAESEKEVFALRDGYLADALANLKRALREAGHDEEDRTAPFALTEATYQRLIDARGNEIKNELQRLMDGLSALSEYEHEDQAAEMTAQLIVSGGISLGGVSQKAAAGQLAAGATEAAAAYFGVTTATVAVVAAVAVLVIVAIIIPIVYFILKPAACIVLLINELEVALELDSEYNVSGKPSLATSPIDPAVVIPDVKTVPVAGFIISEKKESALVGTQYGFVMKAESDQLAFGTECPLTALYTDNNCFCDFDISAEKAAEKTEDKNKQEYEADNGKVRTSIRVNSGAGSHAYYIARAGLVLTARH